MKQKDDFITNSSSASFILTLEVNDKNVSLDEFKELFNVFIEEYLERNPSSLKFWDATNIKKIGSDNKSKLFKISEWTSMYNYQDDIPKYMRELMVNSYIDEDNFGFKVKKFNIEDDY